MEMFALQGRRRVLILPCCAGELQYFYPVRVTHGWRTALQWWCRGNNSAADPADAAGKAQCDAVHQPEMSGSEGRDSSKVKIVETLLFRSWKSPVFTLVSRMLEKLVTTFTISILRNHKLILSYLYLFFIWFNHSTIIINAFVLF